MEEKEGEFEPLSPTSQYFSTSALSASIVVAFEMEVGFQENSKVIELVEKLLLPINPRFSSVMVWDVNGVRQWKKVDVKIEDHVITPLFPNPMSIDARERHIRDYISNLWMNPFSESRPLWEVHNIKYPTARGDGTVVLKLDHSLGDGFSLMGALFSRLKRADNPSLPLTFPHSKTRPVRPQQQFSTALDTARDFLSSLIKTNFIADGISPIRSATPSTCAPEISTFTLPLHKIQQIKNNIGGTVNDVIVGVISYGTRLYMKRMSSRADAKAKAKDDGLLTAVVLLNTRAIKAYKTAEEMNDPNNKNSVSSTWGNRFGFLQIPIPNVQHPGHVSTTPLDFVFKIKEILFTKRNSLAVYLTGGLLDMLRRIKGPEAAGRYIANTLRNTSFGISNLIGPLEKMEIGGHPVNSFYFSVVGTPHSLGFSLVSYIGELKVAVCSEKKLIDSELLVSCVQLAFTELFQQATQQPT